MLGLITFIFWPTYAALFTCENLSVNMESSSKCSSVLYWWDEVVSLCFQFLFWKHIFKQTNRTYSRSKIVSKYMKENMNLIFFIVSYLYRFVQNSYFLFSDGFSFQQIFYI